MQKITLIASLLLTGCVSAPNAHLRLERTEFKLGDDSKIAAQSVGVMTFEPVVFPSSDGLPIPAYLFKPLKSADSPRPAVIYLHGGEHGTFSARGLRRVIPLIEHDWIVLAVDYRGSSGYGQAFYDAVDYGGREIDDILAARDWLVENGHAPEKKIAVLGASHGGYNSLLAVARRPDGFAACVDFYGPTDIVYRVTSTPEENPNASPGDPEKFARMVGATIEENEQAYRDRSPRFLADRIRTPVLIIHGTEDEIVHLRESKWLVDALKKVGHPNLEYLWVQGGHHGWPPDLYSDAWDQVFRFLEKHIDSR